MSMKEETILRKRMILEYESRIGDAVADVRDSQGLDQATVAKAFGCQQPAISKLEAGQRSLRFSEIGLLADSLGVSRSSLIEKLCAAIDGE